MKLRHAITTLATPLLSFAIAISASSLVFAQNGVNTTTAQSERPATTVPNNQNAQTEAAQQQDRDSEEEAEQGADNQEVRDTARNVRTDTDCIDLDAAIAAENGQLSPEAIARLEREHDDCLDLIRNANGNGDANAQGEESKSSTDSQAPDSED